MKSRVAGALWILVLTLSAQEWKVAEPGYRYEFPRDHFDHPDYQTEWWYYTGNLRAANGHRFGFELTFFREAIRLSKQEAAASDETWRPAQIYLAHFALSDIDGGEFYHTERLNRAGPGLAGASLNQQRYWNGNWQVRWTSLKSGEQSLQAMCPRLTLRVDIKPEKLAVINGQNGISQKGPLRGEASHYISFTRLRAMGQLEWNHETFAVTGIAWMDHEFFSESRDDTLAGWDWFAIQLDNNEELMLYRLRTKAGQVSPYSSGTYVDSHGDAHFLNSSQFSVSPGGVWQSAASGARYPLEWKIVVPSVKLELTQKTTLNNQELFSGNRLAPTYWEGAVTYQGQIHSEAIRGVGYLEMTGYAQHLGVHTP